MNDILIKRKEQDLSYTKALYILHKFFKKLKNLHIFKFHFGVKIVLFFSTKMKPFVS